MTPKLNSFKRLNGDPAKGIEGGVLCHALRSELRCLVQTEAYISNWCHNLQSSSCRGW